MIPAKKPWAFGIFDYLKNIEKTLLWKLISTYGVTPQVYEPVNFED